MGDSPRVTVAVATVGLLLFVLSGELVRLGASPKSIRGPIGGIGVKRRSASWCRPTQILSLVVALVVAVGLDGAAAPHRLRPRRARRRAGHRRRRGSSACPSDRVSAFVWGAGAGLTTLGALLVAPGLGAFAPGALGRLFLFGLAAAIVGGLTSLPGAFVGGVVVGLVEVGRRADLRRLVAAGREDAGRLRAGVGVVAAAARRAARVDTWPAGGVMLDRLRRSDSSPSRAHRGRDRRRRRRLVVPLLGRAGLLTNYSALLIGSAVAMAAAGLSLNLLMGYAGQISLGQYSLLGVGAFASGAITPATRTRSCRSSSRSRRPRSPARAWRSSSDLPALRLRGLVPRRGDDRVFVRDDRVDLPRRLDRRRLRWHRIAATADQRLHLHAQRRLPRRADRAAGRRVVVRHQRHAHEDRPRLPRHQGRTSRWPRASAST